MWLKTPLVCDKSRIKSKNTIIEVFAVIFICLFIYMKHCTNVHALRVCVGFAEQQQ